VSPANQMRVLLNVYCAAGMIVFFVGGHELNYRETVEAERKADAFEKQLLEAKAENRELKKRVSDLLDTRDSLSRLRESLRDSNEAQKQCLEVMEGVKWQMDVVVKTCPGRARPPRLPKP